MPEESEQEKTEYEMTNVEKPKTADDEDVFWTDIDELLAEANAPHYAQVKYRNKIIRICWKELSDEEIAAKAIKMEDFQKLSKDEQDKVLQKWLEEDVLAKIKKAGRVEGCLNNNEITYDIWKKLPSRVRTSLMMDVLETRDAFMRSFL